MREPEKLTVEKLEEYMKQLKSGEITLLELFAGLQTVHGAKPLQMTPREFKDWLNSQGLPLHVPDEMKSLFEG